MVSGIGHKHYPQAGRSPLPGAQIERRTATGGRSTRRVGGGGQPLQANILELNQGTLPDSRLSCEADHS